MISESENLKRWRLILGSDQADGIGCPLSLREAEMDQCLSALYEGEMGARKRTAGLGASSPNVARWLGDIRSYFPKSVVQIMQQDAMERLGLRQMLLEPETLEMAEADVNLVSTLVSLNRAIPAKTRETARQVVRKVVAELEKRLADKTRQAVKGALDRANRNRRPKLTEMDWPRTIRANLKNYLPEYKSIIPETRIGYGRKTRAVVKDIVLLVDQSGSMAESVVYSSVFAAILATLQKARTQIVFFDTAVVDMTEMIDDPIDILFGVQLGGGTDIHRAMVYGESKVRRPHDTIFVLISDLIEGGDLSGLFQCAKRLLDSGVTLICLLALNDSGIPYYDPRNAARMCALGAPAFGCTPDLFPDLMAAAIQRRDLTKWADQNEISVKNDGKQKVES